MVTTDLFKQRLGVEETTNFPERLGLILADDGQLANAKSQTSVALDTWLSGLDQANLPELILAAAVLPEWMENTPATTLKAMRQLEHHQRQFAEKQKLLAMAKELILNVYPKMKITTHILSSDQKKIAAQIFKQYQCHKLFMLKLTVSPSDPAQFELISLSPQR